MIAGILLAWLSATLGLWIASRVVPGVRLLSFGDAIWAGALLGFFQWLLSWFIFAALTVFTLGIALLLWFITRWIVAAIVIKITAGVSSRLEVNGFLPALITAFIVAVTGSVIRFVM
ncbi:MAG: phage holin family protein [Polyangiales bacterium]